MSEILPTDEAEKELSDSSRSSSSDSVATGASSPHERASSMSPPIVRDSSKSPLSDLQTIHEDQPLQVSPSPAPGDGAEAVGQQNQRPRSATGQSSIQQQQQDNAMDNQEPPEPPVNDELEPDIVIQNPANQSDSDGQDDSDDSSIDPLLEEQQIDDPRRPRPFTFSLIWPFATKHWSCCSTIYTIIILVFIIALLAALSCITFWAVETIKMKDRTITVSTREVFKLSGLTIPNDHLYSEGLCIHVPDGMDSPIHGTTVKLVAKSECDKVTNELYVHNITEDHVPVPYVFYLLAGSQINVNLVSSGNVEVFLLTNEEVFQQCIFGHIPEERLRVNETDVTGSLHIWNISSSNHYYLCFCTCEANNISEANYSYSLEIDPLVRFDLTGHNLSNTTCNDLGQKKYCLPYESIFTELQNKTCIFVETSIDPYLVGYFKLTVSPQQRLNVLWYSLGLLAVCALIVVVLALLCVVTWRKVRNPDLPGCRHTVLCQLYPGQD